MTTVSSLLPVLLAMLFFSALFSASEAALIAINKVRLRHLMEKQKQGARRVYGLVSRMDKLIATILIGNNLVNTAIAAISTVIFSHFLGESRGVVMATVATTVVLVIFGDLIPKTVATNHPEGVSFFTRHFISFCIFIFRPVTNLLTWISNGMIRLAGGNPHHRSPLVTEEEIRMMIQIGKEEGYYGDNERKMLERIFHFDDTEVRDVMTPLERMVAISADIGPEELERVLLEEGHNRIPVYRGQKDNIVGIIYVRDLLYLFKHGDLINVGDLMSAPFFVTERKKVAELLRDFQAKKIQIAIVRDFKTDKVVGLATLEDLLEEIVGELEEKEPPPQ